MKTAKISNADAEALQLTDLPKYLVEVFGFDIDGVTTFVRTNSSWYFTQGECNEIS